MMNEKLKILYFSDYYPNWLVQFASLVFTLDLRNVRNNERSEIFLPHRLKRTLQQPRAKKNIFLTTTTSKEQNVRQNGDKQTISES